jgi:hypothetical protein
MKCTIFVEVFGFVDFDPDAPVIWSPVTTISNFELPPVGFMIFAGGFLTGFRWEVDIFL